MKCIAIMTLLVAMIFVYTNADSSDCIPKHGTCDTFRSEDCCSRYCRNLECIDFGDSPDDSGAPSNPCERECPSGEICVLQQVQCFRAPCPPIRSCVNQTERAW